MYAMKGFISSVPFNNNTPGVSAKLGELTKHSLTFSRESGQYINPTRAPNLTLTTFVSKEEQTAIEMPALLQEQTLDVAQFTYAQTVGGQTEIIPAVYLENLLTAFVGKATNFECGLMISDGVHTLPEWVSWTSVADPAHPNAYVKIWFVDQSFQQQYDEFEIVVVPPFDVLNNFFRPGSEVDAALGALSVEEAQDRIQTAMGAYPATVVRTNTFSYVDPLNANHTVPSNWSVIIYGASGDNVDSIKDALMAYILANSDHTRAEWTVIFPDIFKRTEFILVPLWDQYAIPNRELMTGIYSPQVQVATILAKMKQFAKQYPEAHIDSNATSAGHPYRSLVILACGSPDNRNAQFRLNQLFPDLISVASTSVDFNRMSRTTQDWATMLANMLPVAEAMSDFTSIPVGMMKVRRDGLLYLTKTYQNINYLVVAKSNFA